MRNSSFKLESKRGKSARSKYIKGNTFVEQDVKNYEKELKPVAHLIEKYRKTFPRLEAYMQMMKSLTT